MIGSKAKRYGAPGILCRRFAILSEHFNLFDEAFGGIVANDGRHLRAASRSNPIKWRYLEGAIAAAEITKTGNFKWSPPNIR